MVGATEKVLNRDKFDLKDLLDCDDILNQVLAPNDKVIRFLVEPENLRELVKFATAPPLTRADFTSLKASEAEAEAENESENKKDAANEDEDKKSTSTASSPTSEHHEENNDDDSDKDTQMTSKRSFDRSSDENFEYHEFQSQSENDLDAESDDEFEDERLKQVRYSKIAAEILTTDVWTLLDALLSNDQAMFDLWSMLDASRPEASTQQLALFTKIVEGLLEKRLERMIAFIRTLPHFVDYFIRYIECQPLVDFLIKIISTDHPDSPTDVIDFLYDQDLIPKMIELLGPEVSHSAQSAAGDFLKAFVNISGGNKSDMCAIGPNELSRQFVGPRCMGRLVDLMLEGGHGMCVAVTVIIEVIRKNNSDYDLVEVMDTTLETHPPEPRDNIYLGTMVKLFSKAIPRFEAMLTKPETATMKMPFGEVKPLGFERFRICELYAELLHCSNMNLLNDPKSEAVIEERDRERNRVYYPERLLKKESHPALSDDGKQDGDEDEGEGEGEGRSKEEPKDQDVPSDSENTNAHPLHSTKNLDGESTLEEITEPLHDNGEEGSGSDDDAETPVSDSDSTPSAHAPNTTPPSSPPHGSDDDDSPSSTPSPATPEVEDDFISEADRQKINVSNYRGKQLDEALDREMKALRKHRVIGDQLKIALDDNYCIDTILNMLFEFPWNNFLHNVVFDIVQQVFNGYIDRSYNKFLAIHLLTRAKLTERIVYGHNANETYEKEHNIRLGYVGHLTLISEEVVKFESVFIPESVSPALNSELNNPAWLSYAQNDLLQLRDQYNTVLGKVSLMSDDEEPYDNVDDDDDRRVMAMELDLIDDIEDPISTLHRRSDSDSESESDSESDSDSDHEGDLRSHSKDIYENDGDYIEEDDYDDRDIRVDDNVTFKDISNNGNSSKSESANNEDTDNIGSESSAQKSKTKDSNKFSRYMSQELNSGQFGNGSSDEEEDVPVTVTEDWVPIPSESSSAGSSDGHKNQSTTTNTNTQK